MKPALQDPRSTPATRPDLKYAAAGKEMTKYQIKTSDGSNCSNILSDGITGLFAI
jgi:hypothetical protein